MWKTLLTIWLLHAPVVMSPGAAVLLTTHLASTAGRWQAIRGACGIALGAALWASAALLGIGGLLHRWPALQVALQLGGAIYLLYVATQMWRSAGVPRAATPAPAPTRAFRTGLLTNLSNPKAALFFASVFSSVMPARPSAGLVLASLALVTLNSLAWHTALASVFSRPGVRTDDARRRRLWSRLASLLLATIGLALLLAAWRGAVSANA